MPLDLDLIQYNESLDVDGLSIEQLRAILADNPPEFRVFTAKGEHTIIANGIYGRDQVCEIPGISEVHLESYKALGLVAKRAANSHLFDGRRIIAYFLGNLKAVVRLEELIRRRQRK